MLMNQGLLNHHQLQIVLKCSEDSTNENCDPINQTETANQSESVSQTQQTEALAQ